MINVTDQEKLEQARTALHQLIIGKRKATVRYGDRQVTYTQADIAELRQYIAELEDLVGEKPQTKRGEPFGVIW